MVMPYGNIETTERILPKLPKMGDSGGCALCSLKKAVHLSPSPSIFVDDRFKHHRVHDRVHDRVHKGSNVHRVSGVLAVDGDSSCDQVATLSQSLRRLQISIND